MRKIGTFNLILIILGSVVCSVFCAIFPLLPVSWIMCGLVASAVTYIYLISNDRTVYMYLIPSCVISLMLSQDIGTAVLAAISLPLSVTLGISVTRGLKRTGAITLMTAVSMAYAIGCYIIHIEQTYGRLALSLSLNRLVNTVAVTLSEIISVDAVGFLLPFSSADIPSMSKFIIYASPATLALMTMCASFIATAFIKLWLRIGGVYHDYFTNNWGIRTNFTVAGVYIISILLLIFTLPSGFSVLTVTALNLTVLITPLMCIIGTKKLMSMLAKRGSVLLYIGCGVLFVALTVINIIIPLFIIAVYGELVMLAGGMRLIVLKNILPRKPR